MLSLKNFFNIGLVSFTCFLVPSIVRQSFRTMSVSTSASHPYSIAYVTIDEESKAKTLAKKIVTSKLAACVNIVPKITSIYEWEDKVNEDNEALMIIKTKTSRVDELINFVKSNHPYEVCEVITTPIEKGNPDYLSWISKIVPDKSS